LFWGQIIVYFRKIGERGIEKVIVDFKRLLSKKDDLFIYLFEFILKD
jgi:hypothetical protein